MDPGLMLLISRRNVDKHEELIASGGYEEKMRVYGLRYPWGYDCKLGFDKILGGKRQ